MTKHLASNDRAKALDDILSASNLIRWHNSEGNTEMIRKLTEKIDTDVKTIRQALQQPQAVDVEGLKEQVSKELIFNEWIETKTRTLKGVVGCAIDYLSEQGHLRTNQQPSLDAIIEKIEGLKAANPTVEGWSISRARVNHKLDKAIEIIKEAK